MKEEIIKQMKGAGLEVEEEVLTFMEVYTLLRHYRRWQFVGERIYPAYSLGEGTEMMIIPHNQWGNDLKGEVIYYIVEEEMRAKLKSGVFCFRITPIWVEDFKLVSFDLSLQIPSCRLDGGKCILPTGEVIPSDLYYYIESDGKLGWIR